jgi:hypothetical protein
MKKHLILKLRVAAVMLLLIVALAVPWNSLAAPAYEATVSGGPKFFMVNAIQFRPYRPEIDPYTWNDELSNPGTEDNFYQAALTLPDNIKINKMVVYFYDKNPNPSKGFCAALWRFDPSTGDHAAMAELCTIDGDGQDKYRTIVDTSINEPLINQQRFSYYIEVSMNPAFYDVRVAAVRLDYSTRSDQQ